MSGPLCPTAADLLREYGEAMRGDWSQIDGRSVRSDMYDLAEWSETGIVPDDARAQLGLCAFGKGHWRDWCNEGCEVPA